MTPEQWAALSALLDQALDLDPERRVDWLARLRVVEPALGSQLEAMFARESEVDPADLLGLPREPGLVPPSLAGQRLGPYVLDRLLGQGGMGTVWLAHRDDGRFQGVAAVKFLSLAFVGAGEARFRREGDVLARLTHPNICRLLDAGVSSAGQPYLILEYVDGERIDRWCDEHRMSIDERLRLFQQVLSAVEHAHSNFIVHRDLKPANILVTIAGTVKLLDFGIAKLLEESDQARTALTGSREVVLTFDYAAPEQIRAGAITTATDVYALGVVLYEILSGLHPTGSQCTTPAEHVVAILEKDPIHLSRTVPSGRTSARDPSERIASDRRSSPDKLQRQFRGDLDNILAKALRKAPAERYQTVRDLGDDIARYLAHEPVSARPDVFVYRAKKFVQRHRGAVITAALVLLGLGAAWVRQRQLLDQTAKEAQKAVAVEQYLVTVFGAADPFAADRQPSEASARVLLDRGTERIDTDLAGQPEVRAELRGALGRVYANLGLYDKAADEWRRSLADRRRLYGPNHVAVAEAMDQLGEVLVKQDKFAGADSLLRAGLAVRRRGLGERSEPTAESLEHLAELMAERDEFDSAETHYREAIAIRRTLRGDSDLAGSNGWDRLAAVLHQRGADSASLDAFRTALAIQQLRLGGEHPATAETLRGLAGAEEALGRYADAERDYRAALAVQRRTLGSNHPMVTTSLNNLGQMLFKIQRSAEAESLLQEALLLNRQRYGENHQSVASNLGNLALIYREEGRFDDAEHLLRQALAIDRTLHGSVHADVAFDLNELGVILRWRGRSDSAVALFREAVGIDRKLIGADHISTLIDQGNLARALSESGKLAEAEPLFLEMLSKLDSGNPEGRTASLPGRVGLGRIWIATGRVGKALPLLDSTLAMTRDRYGSDHWRTAEVELVIGESLLDLNDPARAGRSIRAAATVLGQARRAHPVLAAEADRALRKLASAH